MPVSYAILISLVICLIAAFLEGLLAGKNVKPFFAKLKFPPYSAPLWAWAIIGAAYYAICFFILCRIFIHEEYSAIKNTALILLIVVMAVNAFWNLVFFRLENLFYSFVLSVIYTFFAVALFFFLIQFDRIAALALVPYLLYLIYAFWWGYGLLKMNPDLR